MTANENALTTEQLQALEAAKERCTAADSAFKRYEAKPTEFNRDAATHIAALASVYMPQLFSIIADLRAALTAATARADSAEAERDRLRAALAPFKELGSHYEAYRQEQLAEQEREKAEKGYTVGRLLDFTEWLERRFDAPFVLADLLRAAAALAGDDADGEA